MINWLQIDQLWFVLTFHINPFVEAHFQYPLFITMQHYKCIIDTIKCLLLCTKLFFIGLSFEVLCRNVIYSWINTTTILHVYSCYNCVSKNITCLVVLKWMHKYVNLKKSNKQKNWGLVIWRSSLITQKEYIHKGSS